MSELGEVKRKVAESVAKGDNDKAITELEQAVKEFPTEGSLFNKLGDLYLKVDQKDNALATYEQGARVFKEETYYPNAIALCKKILRLDKEQATVYGLLGDLHKALDQRGEAANYFLEYAERKMRDGDMETTLKTYNTIKELVPNNPKILETISAIYEQAGKKEEGEELLKEAHKLEEKQEKIRETAIAAETVEKEISVEDAISSDVAELLKDEEKSVDAGEVVLEQAPEGLSDIDKSCELGELYLSLDSEAEAIDCFRNAADRAWEAKDYEKSQLVNKKIAGLRPFDLESRQQLVEIGKVTGDKELQVQAMVDLVESLNRREKKREARDLCKKVLKLDPDNAKAQEIFATFEKPRDFIDLGEVLRSELATEEKPSDVHSIESLISQFRREVFESIGEGDYHSRYDLGVAYKGMGLYQEAIEEFEIAAKDEKLKIKALEMVGSCFLERGKIDDAIKVLKEALRTTNHPPKEYFGLYFLLGDCYDTLNKKKVALQYYYNAYKIDKTVRELTKKISKLTAVLKKKVKKPVTTKVQTRKPAPKMVKTSRKPKSKKSKITYL